MSRRKPLSQPPANLSLRDLEIWLEGLRAGWQVLEEDVKQLKELLKLSDTPVLRRSLIRAVFTFAEGQLQMWRVEALLLDVYGGQLRHSGDLLIDRIRRIQGVAGVATSGALSHAERQFLSLIEFTIDKDGEIVSQKYKGTFQSYFKFVIKAFCTATKISYGVDVSTRGWSALVETEKVRHRIVHPKDPNKLNVEKSEIEGAIIAFEWICSIRNDLLRIYRDRLEQIGIEFQP